MRYAIRDCYKPTFHHPHATVQKSMYECEEGALTTYICSGASSLGDRRIRNADDIAVLAEELRVEEAARKLAALLLDVDNPPERRTTSSDDEGPDEPPEPDYDEEYEADRAADRYERWLFRD